MRVSQLLKMLEAYGPDDNLCVLYWDKPLFDNLDDLVLTGANWDEVCAEFDNWEDAGTDVSQWINDAVIEKASEEE